MPESVMRWSLTPSMLPAAGLLPVLRLHWRSGPPCFGRLREAAPERTHCGRSANSTVRLCAYGDRGRHLSKAQAQGVLPRPPPLLDRGVVVVLHAGVGGHPAVLGAHPPLRHASGRLGGGEGRLRLRRRTLGRRPLAGV